MKIDITIKAYDTTIKSSSDTTTAQIIATALGHSVKLIGVTEAKVLVGVVNFSVTSAAYSFIKANEEISRLMSDIEARTKACEDKFSNLDERAQTALGDANIAITNIKEMQLGMWPGVAISKEYCAELQKDATKWTAFMTKYDNYMLYVIQSEDSGPITPTPTPTVFRGFGSTFGFLFGSASSSSKGFGAKFGMLFG